MEGIIFCVLMILLHQFLGFEQTVIIILAFIAGLLISKD